MDINKVNEKEKKMSLENYIKFANGNKSRFKSKVWDNKYRLDIWKLKTL